MAVYEMDYFSILFGYKATAGMKIPKLVFKSSLCTDKSRIHRLETGGDDGESGTERERERERESDL